MPTLPLRASTGSARFWDRVAKKYARSPVSDEAGYQEKLRRTQAHLRHDSTVLEFGCGTGTTALIHAPFASHILATDVSANMIEIAQAKATEQAIGNVTFQQAGVDELDIEPNSLDMVMAHSILHLLEAPEVAIAKAYEWLKPGGVFVSSTVCLRDSFPIFVLFGPLLHKLGIFPYVGRLDRVSLEKMISAPGFELETSWRPTKKKSVFVIARKSDVS